MKKVLDVIDVTSRGILIIFNDEGRNTMMPGPRIEPEPYTTPRKTEEASCCKSNWTKKVKKVHVHLYISVC
jgi:hypothetical protein